jgi:transcriptional regulator GlxA family with amidase domain
MRKKTAKGGRRPAGGAARHTVAVALSHEFSAFEFAVACEVFGIDRSDLGVPWYRFKVCAVDPPPVRAADVGFTVSVPWGVDALVRADTVVVPPPGRAVVASPQLLSALRRAHGRGARIISMCSGAFAMAAAGLLDGRRATTHWMHTDELAERYPAVNVDPRVLYVDDGDVLTSAGSAAGIDLCLHVVRQDFGADVATQVARRMVVPPHRDGGQAQFIDVPVPEVITGDRFAETLEWAQIHLDEAITVEDLARRAAVSTRTFARRFAERTGTTPRQWLLRQRILLSQQLLEATDLSVDTVAARCGLGTGANLRFHFDRQVRTSPSAYRRAFRERAAG